ncbi:dTDP-glucose 4,6-dehydratase, partial [Candidatus Woesebacteria bacterium RIFCSPLOWO2_12_FULL_42_8]
MRLLVTGGCGFIGSNFICYWLKKYHGDKVLNLDKLTYAGHLSSTIDFDENKNYSFVKGDICYPEIVAKCMKNVDIVVHFAAESHVDRSITDPTIFSRTNVLGTQVLLDAALRVKVKRFHHVSTDEVFGDLPLNSKHKFREDTLYNPHSPYAASKAASDHLVRAYHYTFGLPVTITNGANNYGPCQDPEKFMPRAITNLIENTPIKLYGKGDNIRNWLYVEDYCSAIDLVITKGKIGETYLVGGSSKELTNYDVARLIVGFFGLDKKYIKFVKDRSGHDRKYAIDSTKLKTLGWQPKYDFD